MQSRALREEVFWYHQGLLIVSALVQLSLVFREDASLVSATIGAAPYHRTMQLAA